MSKGGGGAERRPGDKHVRATGLRLWAVTFQIPETSRGLIGGVRISNRVQIEAGSFSFQGTKSLRKWNCKTMRTGRSNK